MKNILSTLFFACFTIFTFAQSKITMKLTNPEGYEWAILYKIIDGQQEFIQNTELKDAKYTFDLDKNATKGVYRVAYSMKQTGVIDFIYDGKNVSFTINPENPFESISFENSDENKLFQAYKTAIVSEQTKLDQLQIAYFSASSTQEKTDLENEYKQDFKSLEEKQKSFEKESKNTFAHHLIKSSRRYFSPTLYKTQDEFLQEFKKHYFDYVDFSNQELNKSSLLIDKVIEYVFYVNSSEDKAIQNKLYEESIRDVMPKIGDNLTAKTYITISLLYAFAQLEDYELIKLVLDDYYKKLPSAYVDENVIQEMEAKLKTALGNVAPNIFWKENGKENSLTKLPEEKNFVIVFWSTTCSHCLKEVPVLYEKTKNVKDIKIIAVALEDDDKKYSEFKVQFKNWINVYGVGKWENQFANAYDIHATPTYFILNSKKEIVAKPNTFEDVLQYLNIK
ncbi:TlpA family protein disulfide reductase [Aureivirga marina]|uniref:TlpA family protein disulfide reductase n=1 Tax=Aureivirga marina TaxID=1182451 RepID=UPI0018CA18EA|nr:TlpA disulfide reductase family protein [Aureivirga marina]